jgi:hypothetical protein
MPVGKLEAGLQDIRSPPPELTLSLGQKASQLLYGPTGVDLISIEARQS